MKLIKVLNTRKFYLYYEVINNKGRYEEGSLFLTEEQGEKIKGLKVVYDVLNYLEKEGLLKGIKRKNTIK